MSELLKIKDAVWIKQFMFYVEPSDGSFDVVDLNPNKKHSAFAQIVQKEKYDCFAIIDGHTHRHRVGVGPG